MAIAGVGGGLAADLRPGDLVVASEVTDGHTVIPCPSAALLAGELRRAGLRVRVGRVVTVDHLVRGAERERLAATGALVADMESAVLARAAAGRPLVVVRAISDTPDQPLVSPGVLGGGLAALRSLRAGGAGAGPMGRGRGRARRSCWPGRARSARGWSGPSRSSSSPSSGTAPPVYVRKQIVHNAHGGGGLEERRRDLRGRAQRGARRRDGRLLRARVSRPRSGTRPRGAAWTRSTRPARSSPRCTRRRAGSPADGYLVALIGHAGHEEVDGTLGEAPDAWRSCRRPPTWPALQPADPGKVAYLMQTTLAADEAARRSSRRSPSASRPRPGRAATTSATRPRIGSARCGRSPAESDVVLVAGSANSSNSQRLVETAQRAGTAAYLSRWS